MPHYFCPLPAWVKPLSYAYVMQSYAWFMMEGLGGKYGIVVMSKSLF